MKKQKRPTRQFKIIYQLVPLLLAVLDGLCSQLKTMNPIRLAPQMNHQGFAAEFYAEIKSEKKKLLCTVPTVQAELYSLNVLTFTVRVDSPSLRSIRGAC